MYIRTDQLAKVLIKGKHKGQPGRYPFTSPGRPGLEIVRSVSPKRTLPGIRLEIRSLAVSWIYQACWSIALVEYELISFGEAFRQVPTRCRSVDHVRYCGVWSSETVLEYVWSDTFHTDHIAPWPTVYGLKLIHDGIKFNPAVVANCFSVQHPAWMVSRHGYR